MKSLFYLFLIGFLGFTSCTPYVMTNITKSYSPTLENVPIEIFMDANEVPHQSEALGLIRIADTGFSIKCDSITVVENLKNEARKVGGNAVVVTEYIRPSFWGSSCHQMAGTILRVSDFNNNVDMVSSDYDQFSYFQGNKRERKLPQFTLAADFGYGWRTAKLSKDLSGFQRAYYKGLMSGWVYDLSLNYYFNDYYGIGLLYSAYNSNQNMYGRDIDTGIEGDIKTKQMIYFIGPSFLMRIPLVNSKLIPRCDIGIGYLNFMTNQTFVNERERIYGSTYGVYYNLGVEYKFDKNLALGLNVSSINGTLMSWTIEKNKYKEKKNADEIGEGLKQYQILLGLRYYIK